MERDRTLGHQEPHWKEFRFDLTQIPEGEAVTAAEFRIYKLASAHLLNRTLHVSVFQVVREQSNRCLPRTRLPRKPGRGGDTCQRTEGELPGEHTLRGRRILGRGLVSLWGEAQRRSCCKSLPCCGTLGGSLSSRASVSTSALGPVTPSYIDTERRHAGRQPEPGGVGAPEWPPRQALETQRRLWRPSVNCFFVSTGSLTCSFWIFRRSELGTRAGWC